MRFLVVFAFILLSSINTINSNVYLFKNELNSSKKLYYVILPFTTSEYLIPCGKFFNELEQFNLAKECVEKKVFKDKELSKTEINIPACFIISKQSPDVQSSKDGSYNFISFSIFSGGHIAGFYTDYDHTIYMVENLDITETYRHELQHYFLNLVTGDGNASHDHSIWKECEPPYWSPNK